MVVFIVAEEQRQVNNLEAAFGRWQFDKKIGENDEVSTSNWQMAFPSNRY
jgi:hypothetical protein